MVMICLGLLVALTLLVFRLATWTLPVVAGIAAALLAHRTGAGVGGGVAVGFMAAICAIALGRALAAPHRPVWLRLTVALVFAAPAGFVGFALVHGLTTSVVPSPVWRMVFGLLAGGVVAASAVLKLIAPKLQADTPRNLPMAASPHG